MTRRDFAITLAVVALVSFAAAAVFSAYLRPDMLIEFANLVLCT
ncbi:MAG TPA: hypothetical protein VK043_15380 [Burkholderiales bacterium]|nr:hypothetical protein [Burkholderiales bacterium]